MGPGEPKSRQKKQAFKRIAPFRKEGGVAAALSAWRDDGTYNNIVLDHTVPATVAQSLPFPDDLPEGVRHALRKRGIDSLYTHQAQALQYANQGKSFVVATPTASGKSLCYNLPVLSAMARDEDARAIYLFPTKALSRDQEATLQGLMKDSGIKGGAITFDGDTPGDARRVAKSRSSVLLTNPDMLHAGILPHHASWSRVFAGLRYVVIDEMHTYRGIFGSHLSNVIRRLMRIARFHGSDPVIIGASATIGNPKEHGARIVGKDVELIDESGAPQGEKRLLVYNPPVINADLGLRASYIKRTVNIASSLVNAGVTTLVFGQSRNSVEVMLKYLRERLPKGISKDTVHAYRGGYLPNQRRQIEQRLRAGDIRCVVATSALELGIDVGALDAVVCASYPGSIAGTWQRFGRAGRRQGSSLGVLVTSSAPLDQFVARAPRHLIDAPAENARIDPDNIEILIQHLKCASFELPFSTEDTFGDLPTSSLKDALGFLEDHQVVHSVPGENPGETVYHWATDAYPANNVSLRSVGWDNFVIIDLDSDRNIAEMDWRSTHTMLHEQAIYQHVGEQYQVERLDFDNHKAYVRKVKPDYYTTALTHLKVTITAEDESVELSPTDFSWPLGAGRQVAEPLISVSKDTAEDFALKVAVGEVSVVERVVGYKKIKYHTHENVGYGDVHLPEMQMHTSSLWISFPEAFVSHMMNTHHVQRANVIDALSGLLNAMHSVACIGLMIDPRDLGRSLQDDGQGRPGFDPTAFLFDRVPGGIGLSTRLFEDRAVLLRRARSQIDLCECSDGCPVCIGPVLGDPAQLSRKSLCTHILDVLGLSAAH